MAKNVIRIDPTAEAAKTLQKIRSDFDAVEQTGKPTNDARWQTLVHLPKPKAK